MPPLIKFLLNWTAVGIGAGWLFLAALLLTDTGGMGGLIARADDPATALVILALSFGITFAQITLLTAVLLRDDFGGDGNGGTRLERWKAGHSAEIDRDRPRR